MAVETWDVIVVGAGHAGSEAALAAARMGARTLLLTKNLGSVCRMPCNPSIGGPGKGHLVRELFALGGQMPRTVDGAHLQFRQLNGTKGPAVRALRAQIDREAYTALSLRALESESALSLRQAEVRAITTTGGAVSGVQTTTGLRFPARTVIVTGGTFLDSRIIIGRRTFAGGPCNELPSPFLGDALRALGLQTGRLQTATPPRVHRRSLRTAGLRELPGEPASPTFTGEPSRQDQLSCWMTMTTAATVAAVKRHLCTSPLVLGNITDHGPTHCPSIDRKVLRFPEAKEHLVFLEPEGAEGAQVYLQGLTTSMPAEAQEEILRTVPGLEEAQILRYGYAIEYDYVLPWQLRRSLETRVVSGLFTAGQINGTSGYEEAALQGFLAGVNAVRRIQEAEPFILGRDEAYAGVLVDDLVTKERSEPYRVATSLAEFRLHLRSDNVCRRLMHYGLSLGLVEPGLAQRERNRDLKVDIEICRLWSTWVKPTAAVRARLAERSSGALKKPVHLAELLRRPELGYADLAKLGFDAPLEGAAAERVEIEVKYGAYLEREEGRMGRYRELERIELPSDYPYAKIPGLPETILKRLDRIAPETLGQASRVQGVTAEHLGRLLVLAEDEEDSDLPWRKRVRVPETLERKRDGQG